MPWLFDDQPPLYVDYLSFPPRVTQSKGEVSDEMGDGDVHGACRCSCRYYGTIGTSCAENRYSIWYDARQPDRLVKKNRIRLSVVSLSSIRWLDMV